LRQGQVAQAITHFAAAAHTVPHEARYRAYYAQALAAQGKTQRLAEMEMQAAVKLEPSSTMYRMMLAQLYYDLTFYLRARAEVDRVLALEPNNSAAQALREKLQSR
jgi:predicted Zn-dependent protease